jgi:hypothetical protein
VRTDRRGLVLLLLLAASAAAQDERRVLSPNGQLEFRLALAQPESGSLFRLAYQMEYRGKPLIDTSFLGFNIRNQEPLLGENVGLTGSRTGHEKGYNTLVAEYMQNGSLGRRINVEVRAADDGIAFRYVIPRSTPLEEILIEDELTEFDFGGAMVPARGTLPLAIEKAGTGWVEIAEAGSEGYPPADLTRVQGSILRTRLAARPDDPHLAYIGATPLTTPWRVVVVGGDREHLRQTEILRMLR